MIQVVLFAQALLKSLAVFPCILFLSAFGLEFVNCQLRT